MTIIIGSIICAALLILVSRMPVSLQMAKQGGGYNNRNPRDQQAALTGFGRRAVGAHINSIEAFPLFASGVLLALWTKADMLLIQNLCVVFVCARAAYLISYWIDAHLLRSTVWTVGFVCSVWLMVLALP